MVFQTYLHHNSAKRLTMAGPKFQSSGIIRGFQLVLVVFSTLTAAAIVGSAGHVYQTYKSQVANYNPWWLPVWSGHFDTSGVKTTLGTASGTLILNLFFLALLVIPRVSSRVRVLINC